VTNEGREMRDPAVIKGSPLDEDANYIVVDPQNPLPHPQLGALERCIGLPYEEALFADEVDAEAQEYWFTEPEGELATAMDCSPARAARGRRNAGWTGVDVACVCCRGLRRCCTLAAPAPTRLPHAPRRLCPRAAGGWNSEKVRLRKLQPQTVAEEDVVAHSGADAAGRTPLTAVREGQVLQGTVVAQLLHHGAQVDLGAEYDGILPCQDEQWEEAGELLQVGRQVQVTVHRVRDPRLFRFPIHVSSAGRGRWRGFWPCCWGLLSCC
jgi:hypothetical protein